ncbi:MAG: hypothetical protein HYW07_24680 [Candidatus Latescibacteria bacterium]|nr:hypothetical protein [Candidatus Latescibacterota bacterium]
MREEEYRAQVHQRSAQLIDYLAGRGVGGMWDAHAMLARTPQPERLSELVRQGLSQRTADAGARLIGGPFHVLPCMILLRRWEEELPAEAVEHIREFMTEGVIHRGNTENHWLMYYTGNLLAAERWSTAPVLWNGLTPAAVLAEARRWILGTIERTARLGHHEYDSPQYHIEHMVSLLALADLAEDARVRRQAEQALTLLVADMALEYFHGAWAGGHSREGYRQNTWTRVGPAQILQYLYFGGEEFDPAHHLHGFGVYAAVSKYCPPALFAEMAWDRSRPQVVKKTRAPRTIYRHVERESAPVRKYTYLSPSFALGSTQLGLPGAPAGPIDLVSWDLSWKGPKHQAKIVCNHPYRGAGRFSAFLASLPQTIGRAIGMDKPYLQWPDRLFGASPYEQMMQHEGALVVLYDIPADDEAPFVNLYLPKGIPWVEQQGWLLGNCGSFYVALRPLGDCDWQEIRESNNAAILVTEGDLIDGWLLRIQALQAGLIIEAAEAADTGSFADFCTRRVEAHLDLGGWPDQGLVEFDTLTGHRLRLQYDGPHQMDGQTIDYEAYPLYEAPGVSALPGTGQMRFCRGAQEVRLDFGIDPQQPMIPMRVIG